MNSITWIRSALFGASLFLFGLAACSDSGDGSLLGPEGSNADQQLTDDTSGAPDGSGTENRDSDGNGGTGIVPDGTDEPGGEVVDPVPGDAPVILPPETALSDLLDRIRTLEIDVEDTGELVDVSSFKAPGHVVLIDQDQVHIFVYDSAADAKDQVIHLMSDGSDAIETLVAVSRPRLYALDRFVVLYPGANEAVIGVLDRVLGGPHNGGTTTDPVDGPVEVPDDVIDDPGRFGVVTINNEEELDRLLGLIQDGDLIDRLSAVDFEDDFILAVMRGEMPTAGYSVTIEDVRYDGEMVDVFVSLTNPGPDDAVAQVITYPLAVQVISRTEVQEPGQRAWSVISADGEVLVVHGPMEGSSSGSTGSNGGGIVVDIGRDTDIDDGSGQIEDPLVDPVPDVTPQRGFDIRGSITTFEEGGDRLLARLLIESEIVDRDTGYDQAWVEITDETLIQRSGQEAEEMVGALEPGVRVQVVFDGAVRESYPVQAVAGFVVILE